MKKIKITILQTDVHLELLNKEEDVLPSSSSNYSLAIETYQTDFKPGHEKEN